MDPLYIFLSKRIGDEMCIRDRPTNVQLDNRVLCFNIRDLGQQLRPIGMLVLMEVVMMRVMQNRLRGKQTWIYFCLLYTSRCV